MLAVPAETVPRPPSFPSTRHVSALTGLCRVCASGEEPLVHIFGPRGEQLQLEYKLDMCLRIKMIDEGKHGTLQVNSEDLLPLTVCERCVERLNACSSLLLDFANGQRELERRLGLIQQSSTTGQGVIKVVEATVGVEEEESPRILHTLQPLDSREFLATCRHSLSSSSGMSPGAECDICGNLGVLAAAVERMTGTDTSSTPSPAPSTSSSVPSVANEASLSQVDETAQRTHPSSPLQTPGLASTGRRSASPASGTSSGGRRRQSCEFCGKTFYHTGDLNKHRRCHTGERPYTCIECGKKFAHVSNLLRHGKLHSGERPFTCAACHKSFSRSDKFVSHNCPAGVVPPRRANN